MLTRSQMALLCLGLFLALALCGAWQAFAWGRTQLDTGALVCADTLRLHIRAESDSIASQSAKLHVRDAVLAYLDTACPAQSKPEAIAWAAQHLFELQLTARHALAELNIRTPVRVQLVNMYFATRRYGSGTLPAGRYDALRLTPPRQMSLEQCLEFLADDELLEVTPKSLRMRKAILNHEQRMKSLKSKK